MKFKRAENNLIWENYGNPNAGQMYDDEEYSSEDAEAIISMAPVGPVETGLGPEENALEEVLEDGDDNEIIVKSLRKLIKRATILMDHCQGDTLETWMVAKIIKAEDYISDVWEELDDVADFANDGVEDADDFGL